jgi:glycosyltransferase involved in cell wall biosynthesis
MRILYAAIDQTVPGTVGGSTHVAAVAEGIAALGHDVHVLASPGSAPFPVRPRLEWTAMSPPLGAKALRWLRRSAVMRVAETFKPDVIIERYYNFGGEAIAAGRERGATTVLEVNAPVIDYPNSTKALVDKLLVFEPMRRWRESLCASADLIVTPSASILPRDTPPSKVLELEWGADTTRFHPGAEGSAPFERRAPTVAVFAGAFRSWHGAIDLVKAMRQLEERGRRDIAAVLIGDGPERAAVQTAAEGLETVACIGAIPNADMPAALAAADIGVAPFDVRAHRPLSLGFYWSPLKIFEYMASGLPVVAPAVDRIPRLVCHEREGILYDPARSGSLAGALERLCDRSVRQRMSAAARERAVQDFSWSAHCQTLVAAMSEAAQRRSRAARSPTVEARVPHT